MCKYFYQMAGVRVVGNTVEPEYFEIITDYHAS